MGGLYEVSRALMKPLPRFNEWSDLLLALMNGFHFSWALINCMSLVIIWHLISLKFGKYEQFLK